MTEFLDGDECILIEPGTEHVLGKSEFINKGTDPINGACGSSCFEVTVQSIEEAMQRYLSMTDAEHAAMTHRAYVSWMQCQERACKELYGALEEMISAAKLTPINSQLQSCAE